MKRKFYILDPIVKFLRVNKIKRELTHGEKLVDVGCGEDFFILRHLSSNQRQCYGVDKQVSTTGLGNITIIQMDFEKKPLPFSDEDIDNITFLAVIEHLINPEVVLRECYRILKKNGIILVTAPSPIARPILEFSAKIGIGNWELICDHRYYYRHKEISNLMAKVGFRILKSEYFQFGINNFVKATK